VTLDRWIIDPSTGKLAEQRLDDRLQEFPRIDDRLTGHPHRYGYCAVIGEGIRATLLDGARYERQAIWQRPAQTRPARRHRRVARIR